MNNIKLDLDDLFQNARKTFEMVPQLYFLFYEKKVVYVGTSFNLPTRLRWHLEDGLLIDSYAVVDCCTDYVEAIEHYYVTKFNPEYNVRIISSYVTHPQLIKW